MTEKTDSEVYMLLLVREDNGNGNSGNVLLAGTAYDLERGLPSSGRTITEDEVGEGVNDFVNKCFHDMEDLCLSVVMSNVRDNQHELTALYVKLLTEFADKPVELIGNMLVALLASCILNCLSDPEMDDEVKDWD